MPPWRRSTGSADNTSDLGLGLALSRGLAEAMGGTLTPENTPGGGLTMVLALRAAAAQEPALVMGRRRSYQGSVKRREEALKPGAARHLMGDVNSAWLLLDRPPHPVAPCRAPRCPETSASR